MKDAIDVEVAVELFKTSSPMRVDFKTFSAHLSKLGRAVRLGSPLSDTDGGISLWAEIQISPATIFWEDALRAELKCLDELARFLQDELPTGLTDAKLPELYKEFTDVIEPVMPIVTGNLFDRDLLCWGAEIMDYLTSSASVALVSQAPVLTDFAVAMLGALARETGGHLARLIVPSIIARKIPEFVRKVPGIAVIPAESISLGNNLYEMGDEIGALLVSLSSSGPAVIFTGTLQQLQAVFAGGQGGMNDPLQPVVCHLPNVAIEHLTRFALQTAGRKEGGLPERVVNELTVTTIEAVKQLSYAEQLRIVPMLAKRNVYLWASGKMTMSSPSAFVKKICGANETLAGLTTKPRAKRKPETQTRFTRGLIDPKLLPYFKDHLLAQDHALNQLTAKLATEALTRPPHQPIRYCAQGPPGTGKSESAVLLAKWLGIPFVNIDAASMPNYAFAATQLLGSGRGYVGSHKSGRLEQVAKHHTGVVVEVSDLDHAEPTVRSALADLFLQVLETGEAQSTAGAMFSCSNLILAFTMNLPGAADESVRKSFGFGSSPNRKDINDRVISEIKTMLSGAFLSRVGTPIVFDNLTGKDQAVIVENEMKKAILSSAFRMGWHVQDVILDEGVGPRIIAALSAHSTFLGARALMEHGRSLAAVAVMELRRRGCNKKEKTLHVSTTAEGNLVINPG